MRRAGFWVFATVAATATGAAAVFLGSSDLTPATVLLIGASIALLGVCVGLHRASRDGQQIDPFHPLLLPLAYLAFSFLAPAWAYFVEHKRLLGFTAQVMDPGTPTLMVIATAGIVVGIVVGLAIPLARPATSGHPPELRTLLHAGRLMLALPLAFNVYNAAAGSVSHRGVDQTARTGLTSLGVLISLLIPVGVLLLLAAHRDRKQLLGLTDWALVLGLGATSALTGERSDGVTILLCLMYAHTRRRYRPAAVLAALGAAIVFVLAVGSYRAGPTPIGATPDVSRVDAVLTDLSVATYTTGITAQVVPSPMPYRYGASYLDAAARQLPGEIANRLLGPPTQTGNQAFRDAIGFDNPNQGFGYSLPAEGYLNFGTLGTFLACFAWGGFAALAYARRSWPGERVGAFLYPIIVVTMPIAVRSDALGMFKSVLYPTLAAGAVFVIARAVSESHASRSRPRSPRTASSRTPARPSRR